MATPPGIDPVPPSTADVPWAVALNATEVHDDVGVRMARARIRRVTRR